MKSSTRDQLATLIIGCAAIGASAPASATLLKADFSGTITNSIDNRGGGEFVGRLFGQSTTGGQTGKTITGTLYFDDAIYNDANPNTNIGDYGGTANAFRSVYTIDGKTFDSNWLQLTNAPYSAEQVTLYDPTNINQDHFFFTEQEAYKPLYNQGAYAQMVFSMTLTSNQAIQNFLNGTTIDQVITLGATELANLTNKSGSYTLDLYCGWQDELGFSASGFCPEGSNNSLNGNPVYYDYLIAPWGVTTDAQGRAIGPASGDLRAALTHAAGEFTLTSFSLQRQGANSVNATNSVPEPGTYLLLLGGLSLLGAMSRRRQSPAL